MHAKKDGLVAYGPVGPRRLQVAHSADSECLRLEANAAKSAKTTLTRGVGDGVLDEYHRRNDDPRPGEYASSTRCIS